jgi:hypothetical protein
VRIRIAIAAALLVALAWHERKNKLILFGVLSIILFFGLGLSYERLTRQTAEYIGFAGLACALVCLGIAVKRSFSFLSHKIRGS